MEKLSDYEATIQAIMAKKGWSRDEAYAKVLKKFNEHGIITIEGAAKLVADEVGVKK